MRLSSQGKRTLFQVYFYMWDIAIIVCYFVVIISLGLWKGRREKTLEGYALGNRSMPWWAILASILAAEISAATFLGAPGEGFSSRNFCYAQLCLGTIIGRIVVGKLFLKPYYDYNVVSIYEYLEKRFGLSTRRIASFVFLLSRALASGTRLYVAGILLVIAYQMMSGGAVLEPMTKVWLYVAALFLVTVATAIYTTAGGIKAVVWTDVIQACVLVISLGAALWVLFSSIPRGWDGALVHLKGEKDLLFFSWGPSFGGEGATGGLLAQTGQYVKEVLQSEYTVWSAFLGATFVTMATHGTDQDMVQRMLTGKNSQIGTKAVILSGIIDLPIVLLFLLVGILVYVFYQYHPVSHLPEAQAEIFPYFIMHSLPVGVRGLLVAGLLATAMGSLSTALNSLATSATRDWYQGCFFPKASEKSLLRAARGFTLGFSLLLILIGGVTAWYTVTHPEARIIPIVLGIFGYTYGSLLGVFLLGMLTKTRGNDKGNALGMLCGFIVVAVLSRLIPLPASWQEVLPDVAFPWRVTLGTITTFGVAWCFSSPKLKEAEKEASV